MSRQSRTKQRSSGRDVGHPSGAAARWWVKHPAGGILFVATHPSGQAGMSSGSALSYFTCQGHLAHLVSITATIVASDHGVSDDFTARQAGATYAAYPTAAVFPGAHDHREGFSIRGKICLRVLAVELLARQSNDEKLSVCLSAKVFSLLWAPHLICEEGEANGS